MKHKQLTHETPPSAYPWPLRLARQMFRDGALTSSASFVRSGDGSTGFIMFQTQWGDLGMLVGTDTNTARKLSEPTAKTLVARNFPGVQLMS